MNTMSVLLLEHIDGARLAFTCSEAWSALNITSNVNNDKKTLFPQTIFSNNHISYGHSQVMQDGKSNYSAHFKKRIFFALLHFTVHLPSLLIFSLPTFPFCH